MRRITSTRNTHTRNASHQIIVATINPVVCFFFFFNDTATTEIYTLSLHDALPIYLGSTFTCAKQGQVASMETVLNADGDRKSTRLNSSHQIISYAVFCLKKKKCMFLATR